MKKSVFVLMMSMLILTVGVGQAQNTALTEVYQSHYFHLQFEYPAGWFIVERSGGVQLLNYEYDNDGPNAPGEARMQFLTASALSTLGIHFDHSDPVLFLNTLRLLFSSDDNNQSPAEAMTLGDRAAARADGVFRGSQTVYLGAASASGDLLFISGEAALEDFATFEPLFLQIAETAHYTPPTFADPLPPITVDNAAQVARYLEFASTRLDGGQTEQVLFSPDGTLAVNALGFDGVQVWDAISGDFIKTFDEVRAREVAFSPDSGHLAAFDFNTLQKVDLDGSIVTTAETEDDLYTIAYSPDGAWIAAGSNSGALRLWDAETLEVTHTLAEPDGPPVRSVVFSPDSRTLAASGSPGSVVLWDVDRQSQSAVLTYGDETAGRAESIAFSLDGSRLAVLGLYGSYTVFDTATGAAILSGQLEGDSVFQGGIVLNNDGSLLAVTTLEDGYIALIDVMTDTPLAMLSQGGDHVSSMAFSPDGTRLLAGGFYQDTLVMWAASLP